MCCCAVHTQDGVCWARAGCPSCMAPTCRRPQCPHPPPAPQPVLPARRLLPALARVRAPLPDPRRGDLHGGPPAGSGITCGGAWPGAARITAALRRPRLAPHAPCRTPCIAPRCPAPLRSSGASGFLLPLSGGADSSSVAAIVGLHVSDGGGCGWRQGMKQSWQTPAGGLTRVLCPPPASQPAGCRRSAPTLPGSRPAPMPPWLLLPTGWGSTARGCRPQDAAELAHRLLATVYMGTEVRLAWQLASEPAAS